MFGITTKVTLLIAIAAAEFAPQPEVGSLINAVASLRV